MAQPGFVGYGLNDDFGEEPIAGRIIVNAWAVRFESEQGVVEIKLDQLEIEKGDARRGPIFLSSPAHPGWRFYTFDERILSLAIFLLQTHTRNQIQELRSRGELKRRLIITGCCIGVIVLVTMGISFLSGLMVRSLVARIPPEVERQIGNEAIDELKQTEVFVEDPVLKAQLDRTMAPLLKVVPSKGVEFKSYIMADPDPNAFALPGGHIVVTTGLLKLADRPEQVAAAVAHELAHVTQKHSFRQAIASAGPFLLFRLFLGGSGLSGLIGQGSALLVSQSFSQDYELEADAVGWDYLVAAHIDPRSLSEILRKLQSTESKAVQAQIRAFSSHPSTEKRVRRLASKWAKLKNKSAFVELPRD